MRPTKLAAYLDEAHDDPILGCAILKSLNIQHIALRRVLNTNICSISDDTCKSLKQAIKANGLSVVLVHTDIGNIESSKLSTIDKKKIDRAINITQYYNSQYIQIGIGQRKNDPIIKDWMEAITDRTISANIVPLCEITHDSSFFKPADIAQLLKSYKRWKLLYDPAQLIIKQSQDPYIRYWLMLKQYIGMIDIHDFKIGQGHKPVGFGDGKLLPILNDDQFKGWYILEPSLGRRYGGALTKSDTFKLALDALDAVEN